MYVHLVPLAEPYGLSLSALVHLRWKLECDWESGKVPQRSGEVQRRRGWRMRPDELEYDGRLPVGPRMVMRD